MEHETEDALLMTMGAFSYWQTGNTTYLMFPDDLLGSDVETFTRLKSFLLIQNSEELHIYLCNSGGSIDLLISLINILQQSPSRIVFHVIGPCYSAGAMLALCGDDLLIYPNSYLMFHNFSVDLGETKAGALNSAFKSISKNSKMLYKELLFPFLTEKELADLNNDKDVYVHYTDKDLKKRLKRHFKR